MDDIVKKRLIISKRLYAHGELHSFSSSSLDRMLAVHHFDNSVEIILKNILLENKIKTENELKINFDTFWASVNNHEPFKNQNQKLPYESEMKGGLRTLRNRIQHHADVPSPEDVEKYRIATRAFLERVFDEYFDGTKFYEISAINWIEDEWIRERLKEAHTLLSQGNSKEALIKAYFALAGFRKRLANYFLLDIGRLNLRTGSGGEPLTEIFLKAFEKLIFCNHRAVLLELSRITMEAREEGRGFAPNINKIEGLEEIEDPEQARHKIDEITAIIDTFQTIYQGDPCL